MHVNLLTCEVESNKNSGLYSTHQSNKNWDLLHVYISLFYTFILFYFSLLYFGILRIIFNELETSLRHIM